MLDRAYFLPRWLGSQRIQPRDEIEHEIEIETETETEERCALKVVRGRTLT